MASLLVRCSECRITRSNGIAALHRRAKHSCLASRVLSCLVGTSWDFSALSDVERELLRSIFLRTRLLHDEIALLRVSVANMHATADEAINTRAVGALHSRATAELDDCYRRLSDGTLHALEMTHWLPVIESIRGDLRRATNALMNTRGARLDAAVAKLRESIANHAGMPFEFK
jgi:hypothetical protein